MKLQPGNRVALLVVASVGLLGAGLRALAVPRVVGDVDSVNFARALVSYDPLSQAPHFPGYPVYVLMARILRELGVQSDVWALALPAILLWPAAALLLFLGARRLFDNWVAFGAVLLASLAPAAVVVGGWPASDGLGLALLAASAGALALAGPSMSRPTGDRVWALAGGILLGLTLGIRLSWWPVAAVFLLLVVWRWRPIAAVVLWANVIGVLLWIVPLAAWVGPKRLVHLAWGFTAGHVSDWGGTAFSTNEGSSLIERSSRAVWAILDAGVGGLWLGNVPMSNEPAQLSGAGVVLALLMLVACAGLLRKLATRPIVVSVPWLLLAAAPYCIWVVGFQNVTKARHLVVLLPVLGALTFAGFRQWKIRPALGAALALALVAVAVPRALHQGAAPVPAVAMAQWVVKTRSPNRLQIFAGEEARVFEYHAPSYRVLRPADADVLVRETHRLASLGVEVWVTSGTPGVAALAGHLTPIGAFHFPVNVRAHDSDLTMYRYSADPHMELSNWMVSP